MLRALAAAAALLLSTQASADLVDTLAEYKGYTIVDVKTIAGYIDSNGKRSDDFEGCENDRQIVFDDGTALTCSSFHYHYAYRPRAAILMQATSVGGQNFASVVMIVDDDNYSMRGVLLH